MTRVVRVLFAGTFAALPVLAARAQRAVGQAVTSDSATASEVLRSTCGRDAERRDSGLLRGLVRDASGHALVSVPVTVTWRVASDDQTVGARPTSSLSAPILGMLSDVTGKWHVCGVPLRTPVTVRAVADEGTDERTVALDEYHRLVTVDLTLRKTGDARGLARTPQASALVVFSVVDRRGTPLPDVTLDVVRADGHLQRLLTDSAGRALLLSITPGVARVRARRIGFQPGELLVALDVGRNTVPLILDAAAVPVLAAVRIIGDREVLARHQEFELRHRLGQATASITAADIQKRNPVSTWQMLTTVPAMRVIPFGPGVFAMSNRGLRPVQKQGKTGVELVPCWYRVMIDGVALPDSMPDLGRLPPPSELHGIEVFAGPASIPAQYNSSIGGGSGYLANNSCGLIAIWTK